MRDGWFARLRWPLGWLVLMLAGSLAMIRVDIAHRRDAFQSEARIAHRLLSQRASQHDTMLATLAMLSPSVDATGQVERQLASLYPQVLAILKRERGQDWPGVAERIAEVRSRVGGKSELGSVDTVANQFTLVHAGPSMSLALRIDVQRMVPWDEWPIAKSGPVSVSLVHAGQTLRIQAGAPPMAQPHGMTDGFVYSKPLAVASQPFDLQLRQATGPTQWPWGWLSIWAFTSALALASLAGWQQSRRARRRAEELLRVGRVARLNAMGELAAGVAHELNQPLAAVMANAQAARRLLDDEPPTLDTARQAIVQIATQARRAADVLAHLRRRVEAPESSSPPQAVQLQKVVRDVLELVEPEVRRLGVTTALQGASPAVHADPVALEQIVHNLVINALQALESVPRGVRRLVFVLDVQRGQGVVTVCDNGPGIAPESLTRLFEPFFTTRQAGMGLGLNLCETLVQAMRGTLEAHNATPQGAEFRLALPLAGVAP